MNRMSTMDSCGNCGKGFDASSFSLSRVMKILDYRNGDYGKIVPEEISINCALSLIYSQFKYDCSEETENLAYCQLCAHTLTIVYNAFKEFILLRQAPVEFSETPPPPRKNTSNKRKRIRAPGNNVGKDVKFATSQSHAQFNESNANNYSEQEDEGISYGNEYVDVDIIEVQDQDQHDSPSFKEEGEYQDQEDENPENLITEADPLDYDANYDDENYEDTDDPSYNNYGNFYEDNEEMEGHGEQSFQEEDQEGNDNNGMSMTKFYIAPEEKTREKNLKNGEASLPRQPADDEDNTPENYTSGTPIHTKRNFLRFQPRQYPSTSTSTRSTSLSTTSASDRSSVRNSTPIATNGNAKLKVERDGPNAQPKQIRAETLRCEECQRVFATKTALETHMTKDHQKLFQCDHCEKSFTHNRSLTLHKVVHLEPSKATCKICNRLFGRHSDLKRHIKNVHLRLPRQTFVN